MRYPRLDSRNYTFSVDTITLSMNGLGGLQVQFRGHRAIWQAAADTISVGHCIFVRPVEIEFPARGLSLDEQRVFALHLAEQEMQLNQLSLPARSDLELNLHNYHKIKRRGDASRTLARRFLPGAGEGLDAAHNLDVFARGFLYDFADFRSPIQQRISALWRTMARLNQPGQTHRLASRFE